MKSKINYLPASNANIRTAILVVIDIVQLYQ